MAAPEELVYLSLVESSAAVLDHGEPPTPWAEYTGLDRVVFKKASEWLAARGVVFPDQDEEPTHG